MDSSKPDEFAGWITLKSAYDLTRAATKDAHVAATSLLHRLGDGVLIGAAEKAIRVDGGTTATAEPKDKMPVPRDVWAHVLGSETYLSQWDGWKNSDVILAMQGAHRTTFTLKYYGVRLFPATFQNFLNGLTEQVPKSNGLLAEAAEAVGVRRTPGSIRPSAVPIEMPAPQAKHGGGAPRKEFWDDLWLAMFERLWLTDWKPKNQTEVENAMLYWAAKQGHKLGSTIVKKPAGKLFLLTKK
jgi:hypothetical protein